MTTMTIPSKQLLESTYHVRSNINKIKSQELMSYHPTIPNVKSQINSSKFLFQLNQQPQSDSQFVPPMSIPSNTKLITNQYVYAYNNPINFVDPDGNFAHIVIVVVGSTLVVVILIETIVYYVTPILQEKSPHFPPGPAQSPYVPLNPLNLPPTGRLPSCK